MLDLSNPRVLKAHVDAAKAALTKEGGYPTIEAAAAAVADAVIMEQGPTRWVVITSHGGGLVYGPYASADTARKAAESGLMLGEHYMVLPMQPVPRKGHR